MPAIKFKSHPHREAKRIMRLLSRRRSYWREEPILRQLSPMQIQALQEYIAYREQGQRRVDLTALHFMIYALVSGVCTGNFMTGLMVLACETPFFILFLVAARQYPYAVYALTQTDDMRVLPTLIQATRQGWGWHPQVRAAILRLLEQVTEEHVGLLNDAAEKRLWKLTMGWQSSNTGYDHEIAISTLRALAAIGNYATLTRIKRYANHSEYYLKEGYVIAAARELTPIMEARLQRQQVPETLLRPADTPTPQPETLLRAAHPATAEPPQQLLRASTAEEREP